MSNWFFIEDKGPLPPRTNMAVDEHLFNLCHQRSAGFFRIYSWEKPSFSIGVSQKVSRAVDINFISEKHLGLVRRITGGKTVLHDDEITYSVVSSEEKFFKDNDLYKSYSLIARIILKTLQRSGIDAVLSDGSDSLLSKSSNPCFSFPTPNEIEVSGKKIVGSAQKRDKTALLQHGSMPLTMNYRLYAEGTGYSEKGIRESMTTVCGESAISRERLVENFAVSFSEFIGSELQGYEYSEEDKDQISLLEKKYESEDWTFLY